MKIALRQKRLNGGNASLYLDYYEKGRREYEFLDLYLVPDGAPDARRLNEATLQKAAAIKAERTLNPDGRLGGKRDKAARDKAASTPRLTEWIQTVHDMKARAGFSKSVLCTTIHIKALVGEYLAFAKKRDPRIGMVDKGFLVGFLQYLKNGHANATCRNSVRPLAGGSLRQYRQQMVAILNAAVNEDIIERNPFSDLGSRDTFAPPRVQPGVSDHRRVEVVHECQMRIGMCRSEGNQDGLHLRLFHRTSHQRHPFAPMVRHPGHQRHSPCPYHHGKDKEGHPCATQHECHALDSKA